VIVAAGKTHVTARGRDASSRAELRDRHWPAVVRLGNGDVTLQAPIYSPGSGYAAESVIGDSNNDGKLDLPVRGGSGLNVLKVQGDGSFQIAGTVPPYPIHAVVAGDVNANGKLDWSSPPRRPLTSTTGLTHFL
jgi:hypothetical protein